jgi:hypothetical protein
VLGSDVAVQGSSDGPKIFGEAWGFRGIDQSALDDNNLNVVRVQVLTGKHVLNAFVLGDVSDGNTCPH